MSPEQVPAELVEAAKVAVREQVEAAPGHVSDRLAERIARAALAAVLPLAQAAALEEASVEVLSLGVVSGSGVHVGRRAASWLGRRAARLREGSPS